jgi:hypothetical protein
MITCNPFQTTKKTLESNNQTQLAALTREEILGDMTTYLLANASGQSIYRIDSNIDAVLPNIHTGIQGEIQSAVNNGNYVITHTDKVNVPGWSGCGYIIINPYTGDGAYMISGGSNGGELNPINGDVLNITSTLSDLGSALGVLSGLVSSLLSHIHNILGWIDSLFSLLDTYEKCGLGGALDHVAITLLMSILSFAMTAFILAAMASFSLGGVIFLTMAISIRYALIGIMVGLINGTIAGYLIENRRKECEQ